MMMYQERFYRKQISSKFNLEISYQESDLYISSDKEIDESVVEKILKKYYEEIACYIKNNPRFMSSLSPLQDDSKAPAIIKDMIECSRITGIGPFSSVAGAIAQYVGNELCGYANEVIVENGGDIFFKIVEDKKVGLYLGKDFKQPSLQLKIKGNESSFGIASSSGQFGHSLSFGKADLVTVLAKNAVIADGFATAFTNRIQKEEDIERVFDVAKKSPFINGVLIALEGKIFLWGDLQLE
ncbi:MAG: UPF0280 family protein [Candidatus Omnitrophota bacterium]|nr:MAG: UPF0280 family protein [Candidatus Omnitrophota bacterium]